MQADKIWDAVVLGAGLAGSCAAKALADRGWSVLVLDRRNFPRHKVCGEFLSPEARQTLQLLGLDGRLADLQPAEISHARIVDKGGAAAEFPLPQPALGISRYRLDEMLHEAARASGVELVTGMTALEVRRDSEGCAVRVRKEGLISEVKGRLVITAWGSYGKGRSSGAAATADSGERYIGVKTHLTGIRMEGRVELYFFSGGYCGLSPTESGAVNAAALIRQQDSWEGGKSVDELLQLATSRNRALAARLQGVDRVEGTQSAVSPVIISTKPLAWDGGPLIGDAALQLPPLCGDGMSMAVRSAWHCACLSDRFLRKELDLAELEARYTNAIAEEFAAPLRWGRLVHRLAETPLLPRLVLDALSRSPRLAQWLLGATRLRAE